eukprot:CAMPEP_0204285496 /NCGR_PEP_ID=MMETSP0468-20130131/50780_1 /ASSEMBLY_ACC=CAM_ASM_000383 /TAXON_ID=2969 /ORGANISM="Oxyrrhis marina" /LENGTH=61 /DNA_ID=CAMNT_0051263327 /DNA_START=171 /DNA_END=356 /DNA_ORIENTATION=-
MRSGQALATVHPQGARTLRCALGMDGPDAPHYLPLMELVLVMAILNIKIPNTALEIISAAV